MMQPTPALPAADSERDPIDLLAEEFAERCRRGEQPSLSEYTRRYPQWTQELRDVLPPVAHMERLKRHRQAARPAATPAVPAQLGDYRIVREVGRGGMGIVYEALQQQLGRRVALKVLPGHSLLDPKKLARFQREAQAASRLHHSNIVPVFAVGDQDGLHYYVMQYIDGQGLDAVLAGLRRAASAGDTGRGPAAADPDLPGAEGQSPAGNDRWEWVARVGLQVASALDYAHQQGTLHRDVKPANLLLDRHGTVWVTDFGLAKLSEMAALTDPGDVVGTLHYLAPESLHGQADARADVYSLGLTLYELLTLERPFRGSTPARLLQEVSDRELSRPRRCDPAIPRDLETIVLKATAREPPRRYQTAGALAEDLRRFLEDRPLLARRETPVERLWRWGRRNRALAGLTATALASLLLAAAVGWVGYVKTGKALEGESRKHHEAERATALAVEAQRRAESARQQADGNVRLSLQSFEEIFNTIAPREAGPPPPAPWGRPRPDLTPRPSEEEAALFKSVLEFYDRFAQRNATHRHLQKEAARAHRRVAEIYQRLGQAGKAQAARDRAAALYEALAAAFPDVPDYRRDLAETLADTSPKAAGGAGAEKRLRRALALAGELTVQHPGAINYRASQARAQHRLAAVLLQRKQAPEAEAAYRQAVGLWQGIFRTRGGRSLAVLELSAARQALADLLLKGSRPADARPVLETAVADLQRYLKHRPWFSPGVVWLNAHSQSLVAALKQLKEPKLAEAASRNVRPLPRPMGGPHGPGRRGGSGPGGKGSSH